MKPLVAFIYMEGCSACEDAKPEFRKFAQKYGDRLQFAMIDIDKAHLPFPVEVTPSVAMRMPKGVYHTDALKLNGVTMESLEGWCGRAMRDYKQRGN